MAGLTVQWLTVSFRVKSKYFSWPRCPGEQAPSYSSGLTSCFSLPPLPCFIIPSLLCVFAKQSHLSDVSICCLLCSFCWYLHKSLTLSKSLLKCLLPESFSLTTLYHRAPQLKPLTLIPLIQFYFIPSTYCYQTFICLLCFFSVFPSTRI